MPRRILHHGSNPAATPTEISERVVAGCWFEWNRQGGCGASEIRLRDNFADRAAIEAGDWVSIESEPGVRWYLGRIESKEATYPSGIRLRLEGMAVELGEVFPGGFGSDADGAPPQRFGATDLFSLDPDRDIETFDATGDAASVVRLIMARYVEPESHISYDPTRVEDAARPAGVASLKIRGEESAKSLIKELAVRAGAAAWGVDESGKFFMLQRRTAIETTLQIGQNIAELEELSDRELLFNRLLLTGDYIYDRAEASDNIALRSFRWRGNYVEPSSRTTYGERRIRLWIPWIRTQADATAFTREFFRTYSRPQRRYRVTTGEVSSPAFPWLGAVRLLNAAGFVIATGICDQVRVLFDRGPRFQMEIGPEDPRNLWPEPAQDERYELPARPLTRGGDISVTSLSDPWTDGGGGGGGGGESSDSTGSEVATSGSGPDSSHSSASDLSFESGLSEESSSGAGSSGLTSGASDVFTGSASNSSDASDHSGLSDGSEGSSGPDASSALSSDGDSGSGSGNTSTVNESGGGSGDHSADSTGGSSETIAPSD